MPLLPTGTDGLNRDQVENKMLEIQAKKRRMDDMLQELHRLRTESALPLNNGRYTLSQSS